MLGLDWSKVEMAQDTWQKRLHPDDAQHSLEKFSRLVNGETDYYENFQRLRHADGGWRNVFSRGRVIKKCEDGMPLEILGVCIDLTSQGAALSRPADDKNGEKSQLIGLGKMASSIAHEINNPLSVIRMNAEL